MKRFMVLFIGFLLCLQLVSCNLELEGIGENKGSEVRENVDIPAITENLLVTDTLPNDTDVMWSVCVDWCDFVRVGGIVYDGGFKNIEIDESRVGEHIGEILYKVKSSYDSEEEFNQADKRDYTAAFRPVGCAIFTVKGDEDSIAVLDRGKYYLYTHKENNAISFEVFGGENYYMPGSDDVTRGVTINSFDQLCEAYGGSENIPEDILLRYSDDILPNITLVIVQLVSGWGGTEYGIKSVSKSGDDLLVNAVKLNSDADGDSAMHYWTFFIEIPKTDDKKVIVEVDEYDPLAYDSELKKLTYEEISEFPLRVPGEDYGRYEGQAVLNKYAAEEVLCGMYNYTLINIDISYNPTYNYWITKHLKDNNAGTVNIVYTVIRAADGKCISQWEAH